MTFIDRLQKEKKELDTKISALMVFINTNDKFAELSQFQQETLKKQSEYMRGYASCINLRIDDLKE
jgi:hypothetical protein